MKITREINRWEDVKEHIFLQVVNYGRNRAALEELAYVPFLDLAVLFFFDRGTQTYNGFFVTKNHLLIWNQDSNGIFQAAKKNTFREDNTLVRPVTEELGIDLQQWQETDSLDETLMMTLSNKSLLFGAAMLMNTSALKKLANRLRS